MAEANMPTRGEGFTLTKSQSPMGRSPNPLVSNANRNHQQKSNNGPTSSITKVRPKRSSESGNEEENVSGRILYDDPQVNSIAWANNMVEAMMSDSDDDEKNENEFREKAENSEDDSGNQVSLSPSKKVKC